MSGTQEHAEAGSLGDALYFFQRFLRNPRQVASVVPSSRYLANAMFDGLGLEAGDVLVEFGPGTGAFTREVSRLRHSGLDLHYLGIERDAGLHRRLCTRFPDLDFQLGDVRDAASYVAARHLPPVRVVLSGLPLMWMPAGVVDDVFDGLGTFLRKDGVFRTFSYVHNYPTQGAIRLRARLSRAFTHYDLGRPVFRNVPPAFVMCCSHPIQHATDGETVVQPPESPPTPRPRNCVPSS